MRTHPFVQFWNIKESACTCTLGKMIQIEDINETLKVPLDFSVTKTKLNNQESLKRFFKRGEIVLLFTEFSPKMPQ